MLSRCRRCTCYVKQNARDCFAGAVGHRRRNREVAACLSNNERNSRARARPRIGKSVLICACSRCISCGRTVYRQGGKKYFQIHTGKLTFRCNRSAPVRARVQHNPDLLRNKSCTRHAEFISPRTRIGRPNSLSSKYWAILPRPVLENRWHPLQVNTKILAWSPLISYLANLLAVQFTLKDLSFRAQ